MSTVEWIAVGVVGYLIPSIPLAFVVGRALRRLDQRTADGYLCSRCAARLQYGTEQSTNGWGANGVLTARKGQKAPWRNLASDL